MEVSMVLRPWRNWQTRQLEVLVLETEWRFKSSWPHQNITLFDRAGMKISALVFLSRRFGELEEGDACYQPNAETEHNPVSASLWHRAAL